VQPVKGFDVEAVRLEIMERVTGIEPAWPAWKAGALPLSYTREVVLKPEDFVTGANDIGSVRGREFLL
jgi:hypothetical protein